MSDAESEFRRASRPKELVGLDAELYDALAECGRIVEAMPHDERHQRVARFLGEQGMFLEGLGDWARDFVVGVFIVAHARRMFDQEWEAQAREAGTK